MPAPDTIYLQTTDDDGNELLMSEYTWCPDRINDEDVEYIRSDNVTYQIQRQDHGRWVAYSGNDDRAKAMSGLKKLRDALHPYGPFRMVKIVTQITVIDE